MALGGPIGIYDHEAYPVVTEEIALLRARLAANRPTLGSATKRAGSRTARRKSDGLIR